MSYDEQRNDVPWIEQMAFFVYIVASRPRETLYIGMTDDLTRRVWQHQNGTFAGFTLKYGVKTLVWFEEHTSRDTAFTRERQMKKWNRAWNIQLIEASNPDWSDLAADRGV